MKNPGHREILARIPRRLKNRFALKQLAIDFGAWAGLVVLNARYPASIIVGAISAVGFAVLSFRAFGLMHECVHSAGSTNRRFNNFLGTLYGVLCFLPFKSWQRLHLDHHMWTGNVERDPSMDIILRFKKNGFRMAAYASWSWTHWIPVFAFLQHIVFWRAVRGKELASVAGSIGFLAASGFALGIPATATGLTIYLYMVEIINFPHHLELPQYDGEARFAASEQAQFARSCIYPKWFARHVLLNFNLHSEHHLFPAHPWYQLEELHREIKAAGKLLNVCDGNEWILKNRSRAIETVLLESFASERKKESA